MVQLCFNGISEPEIAILRFNKSMIGTCEEIQKKIVRLGMDP